MKVKRYLVFCPTHGFATFTELLNVTALQFASCGCWSYEVVKTIRDAINKADLIRHPQWRHSFGKKNFRIGILVYEGSFFLRIRFKWQTLQYRVHTFWNNLLNIFNEH